jgi:hypothetical protein
MQSPYAHVAPSHLVEAGREKAHRLLGRGRKHLHEMCRRGKDCRVLLKKPQPYAWLYNLYKRLTS